MTEANAAATAAPARRIRLGMVGGGEGAFIGAVHRLAARMDDRYQLVAGALAADPERAATSAAACRIAPDRSYTAFEAMAKEEAGREDGIDAVAIVTPNHLHHRVAKAFLEAGIHVICEKPMTTTIADAEDLVETTRQSGLVFGLTHNYTGYPMVRETRARVRAGMLGRIRVVQVEYAQQWLTSAAVSTKQAAWRTDRAQAGAGGAIGDIGSHAFNLAAFITGLEIEQLAADLSSFGGLGLDDNGHIMLRYHGGARGLMWVSQVAPGNDNALRIRIYGEDGGLAWQQEEPNQLEITAFGQPTQILTRRGAAVGADALRVSRVPPGHPEGYLEGFANLYRDLAEQIVARLEGRDPDPAALLVPTVEDGLRGVRFIDACVDSSSRGGIWLDARQWS